MRVNRTVALAATISRPPNDFQLVPWYPGASYSQAGISLHATGVAKLELKIFRLILVSKTDGEKKTSPLRTAA